MPVLTWDVSWSAGSHLLAALLTVVQHVVLASAGLSKAIEGEGVAVVSDAGEHPNATVAGDLEPSTSLQLASLGYTCSTKKVQMNRLRLVPAGIFSS
jgi:hypothetical protein